MSFGLTNAPAYFMYLMSKVFMEYPDMFVIVFINAIMVCTKDEREYKEHLCLILQKSQDPILYAKLSKCKFWSEPSASLELHYFRRRNAYGFQQDWRYVKLECTY
jgi:hypothetical protein